MFVLVSSLLVALLGAALSDECPEDSCPSSHTCCTEEGNNQFGCCPYPEAICCNDGLHCCPSGSVCDLTAYDCVPQMAQLYQHTLSDRSGSLVEATTPEESEFSFCGGTICMEEGTYKCCSYENAVCCEDTPGCCRKGQTCNNGTCMTLTGFKKKRPSRPIQKHPSD